jgi:hypothetical protein
LYGRKSGGLRKVHEEEIKGTRKGLLEERVWDYSRKGHLEEIDGTRKGFMEERVWDYSIERTIWKKYCRWHQKERGTTERAAWKKFKILEGLYGRKSGVLESTVWKKGFKMEERVVD